MKIPKQLVSLHRQIVPIVPVFLPAVLALAALGILAAFVAPFGTSTDDPWVKKFLLVFPPKSAVDTAQALADLTGAKLVWLVTGASLTTVALGLGSVALLAGRRIAVDICGQDKGTFARCALMILAVGIAVGLVKDMQGHYWFEHIMVSLHKFEPVMGPDNKLSDPTIESVSAYGMSVGAFTTIANISIGFACMALLTLAGTLLVRTQQMAAVAEQVRHLDLVPYLGAPVLILGVAEVFVLYRYAALAVEPAEAALALARSVSSAVGITFSALLAIAYLVPWIDLRSRVDALYRNALSAHPELLAKREDWLRVNGVSTSAWTGIGRILALLGPALAGTLIDQAPELFKSG
jgi:hypothetical protein